VNSCLVTTLMNNFLCYVGIGSIFPVVHELKGRGVVLHPVCVSGRQVFVLDVRDYRNSD
jgi:hypothetical protein